MHKTARNLSFEQCVCTPDHNDFIQLFQRFSKICETCPGQSSLFASSPTHCFTILYANLVRCVMVRFDVPWVQDSAKGIAFRSSTTRAKHTTVDKRVQLQASKSATRLRGSTSFIVSGHYYSSTIITTYCPTSPGISCLIAEPLLRGVKQLPSWHNYCDFRKRFQQMLSSQPEID